MEINKFYKECKRVFKITKKPTMNEFKKVFQVAGLGVIAIGMIGFLVMILYEAFI